MIIELSKQSLRQQPETENLNQRVEFLSEKIKYNIDEVNNLRDKFRSDKEDSNWTKAMITAILLTLLTLVVAVLAIIFK